MAVSKISAGLLCRCGHPTELHEIADLYDPDPDAICCVDGCPCGKGARCAACGARHRDGGLMCVGCQTAGHDPQRLPLDL